jgi:hypothetical protein
MALNREARAGYGAGKFRGDSRFPSMYTIGLLARIFDRRKPLSSLCSPLPTLRLAHLDCRTLGDEFLGNERLRSEIYPRRAARRQEAGKRSAPRLDMTWLWRRQ